MAQCKAETTKGWRDNLRDLGTAVGVLDMIMLDYPAQDCDGIKGQWAAFEAMLKSGKTKSIAVSNFSPKQLDCIVKCVCTYIAICHLPSAVPPTLVATVAPSAHIHTCTNHECAAG